MFQVIAKEVVNSNKAIGRLTTQKAHMMDMEMALKHQLGVTPFSCLSPATTLFILCGSACVWRSCTSECTPLGRDMSSLRIAPVLRSYWQSTQRYITEIEAGAPHPAAPVLCAQHKLVVCDAAGCMQRWSRLLEQSIRARR